MMRKFTSTLLAAYLVLMPAGCKDDQNSVIFWPQNAVKRTNADYAIDDNKQLAALRKANPISDAETAFKSGDFRPVAMRFLMSSCPGMPEDEVTQNIFKQKGFKVLGYSDALIAREEFKALRQNYGEQYNKMLYDLVKNSREKSEPEGRN